MFSYVEREEDVTKMLKASSLFSKDKTQRNELCKVVEGPGVGFYKVDYSPVEKKHNKRFCLRSDSIRWKSGRKRKDSAIKEGGFKFQSGNRVQVG